MKRINIFYTLPLMILHLAFSACERSDYIIGGTVNESNYVDKTTFDFLSSFEATKETAELIELAGIIEEVNKDITFLAPSNYAVRRYLRRLNNRALRLNPDTSEIKLTDLPSDSLAKFMKMYIVDGSFSREDIPEQGVFLETHLNGDSIRLTLDAVNTDPSAAWDGGGNPGAGYQYSNFMQSLPYLVHVQFKRGENWELSDQDRNLLDPNSGERDFKYRMYISDVVTKTGVVHVIYCGDYNYSDHYYYHTLFFFGTTNDDLL